MAIYDLNDAPEHEEQSEHHEDWGEANSSIIEVILVINSFYSFILFD